MEFLTTQEGLIAMAVIVLVGRYALKFLDKLTDGWFKNTTVDHSAFVTHAQCRISRDKCWTHRQHEEKTWKRDLSAMKLAIFRIGRKLEIEDSVLEKLITDEDHTGG